VFDDFLRKAICAICNLDFSDPQWLQASLPVKEGGLGVRRVTSLAPSAFYCATQIHIARTWYGDVAGWLGGDWVAGYPSHAGIVSKRLNLSYNFSTLCSKITEAF